MRMRSKKQIEKNDSMGELITDGVTLSMGSSGLQNTKRTTSRNQPMHVSFIISTHASSINQGRTNREALCLVKLAVSAHLGEEQGNDQRESKEQPGLAHGGARKL